MLVFFFWFTEFSEDISNTVQIIIFSCVGIGLFIFFIVALTCLVFYQRNRIGHYNFNTNNKQENFSSLVLTT